MIPEFYYADFPRQFRLRKRERSSSYVTDDEDENGRKGHVRKERNHSKTASKADGICKIYTKPENPMKAIARIPAVIRAIGMPLNGFGTSFRSRCSLRPANRTRAIP